METSCCRANGIEISAAIKTKISLARVSCRDADVNLLDDPLLHFDADEANSVMENYIVNGLLQQFTGNRKPCIIMTTSKLRFLEHPMVGRVVVFKDGMLVEDGTYSDLINTDGSVLQGMVAEEESRVSNTNLSMDISHSDMSLPAHEGDDDHDDEEQGRPSNKPLPPLVLTDTDFDLHTSPWKVVLKSYFGWSLVSSGLWFLSVILFMFTIREGVNFFLLWWMVDWSHLGLLNTQHKYYGVFCSTVIGIILLALVRSVVIVTGAQRGSRQFFTRLLNDSIKQLDSMDSNRFRDLLKTLRVDLSFSDEILQSCVDRFLFQMAPIVVSVWVTAVILPTYLLAIGPILYYIYIELRYIAGTCLTMKKITAMTTAPVGHKFTETVEGRSTIRAFGAQTTFLRGIERDLDINHQAVLLESTAKNWLSLRMDLVATMVVFAVTACGVFEAIFLHRRIILAGLAGIAFYYSLVISRHLSNAIFTFFDLEASAMSLEKLLVFVIPDKDKKKDDNADNAREVEGGDNDQLSREADENYDDDHNQYAGEDEEQDANHDDAFGKDGTEDEADIEQRGVSIPDGNDDADGGKAHYYEEMPADDTVENEVVDDDFIDVTVEQGGQAEADEWSSVDQTK